MRDLNRYVVHKHASEWEGIAIELGLEEKIKMIEKDNQGCIDRFKKTLRIWLNLTSHPTWKKLEVAITNVKRTEMSLDPITDVYGKNNAIPI